MTERIMSDGRKMIMLNEPSKELAVEVVYRLVQKRLDAMARAKAEAENTKEEQT